MGNIRTMFDPKTVAFIGASDEEGAVGRAILENLLPSDKRRIFPVNPDKKTVVTHYSLLSQSKGNTWIRKKHK
jgi:acetyltransferase